MIVHLLFDNYYFCLFTGSISSSSTSSTCYCPCNSNSVQNLTSEQITEKLQELKEELTVDKKDLSSWKRKLVSADDHRASAQSIGYVGAVILGAVVLFFVVLDFPRLVADSKLFFRNLCSCLRR